jgi:hypothetical protein
MNSALILSGNATYSKLDKSENDDGLEDGFNTQIGCLMWGYLPQNWRKTGEQASITVGKTPFTGNHF